MSYMFSECHSLVSLSFFSDEEETENLDMSYLFYNCYNLKSLEMSNFLVKNIANMSHMFYILIRFYIDKFLNLFF